MRLLIYCHLLCCLFILQSAILPADSAQRPFIWPQPKSMVLAQGIFTFAPSASILAKGQEARGPAVLLQRELANYLPGKLMVTSSDTACLRLRLDQAIPGPEGYRLQITPGAITLAGSDEAGLYRGVATLLQLVQQAAANRTPRTSVSLPSLQIADQPDVALRGMALQWCFVPFTGRIMKDTARTLALLKYNVIVPELGQNLQNEDYPKQASAQTITRQDFREFVQYAYSWGLDVVPLINTLGHSERGIRWLAPLGNGLDMGVEENYTQLFNTLQHYIDDCPKIRYIMLGMDEASACLTENSKKYGKPTDVLLADHIARITDWCRARGITPVIDHDMLLGSQEKIYGGEGVALGTDIQSYPARQRISKDITLCYWNYQGFPAYPTVQGFVNEGFKVWMMPWAGDSSYTMSKAAASLRVGVVGSTWADVIYDDTQINLGMKNTNSISAYRWLVDAFPAVSGYAWNSNAPVRNGFDPGFDPTVLTLANYWEKSSYQPSVSTPVSLPSLPDAARRSVHHIYAALGQTSLGLRQLKGVTVNLNESNGIALGNTQSVDNAAALAHPRPWTLYVDGVKDRQIDGVNIGRGQDQLVVYTREYGLSTLANGFGAEANVRCGLTSYTSVWGVGNMAIPRNGYVLSGHSAASSSPVFTAQHAVAIKDADGNEVPLGKRTASGESHATIRLNSKANSLVFLQTTECEAAEFMPEIATITIRYADNTTSSIPLRYGRDTCSYDDPTFLYGTEDPPTKWLALSNMGTSLHDGKVIFAYQWQNPQPAKTIVSVEITLTDLGQQIGYYLLALSTIN